jgi:hypothetical protein
VKPRRQNRRVQTSIVIGGVLAVTLAACGGKAAPVDHPTLGDPAATAASDARWDGTTAPCADAVARTVSLARAEQRRRYPPADDAEAARMDAAIDQEVPHMVPKCEELWPAPYRACAAAAAGYADLGECARLTWPAQYNNVLLDRCGERAMGDPDAERVCLGKSVCGRDKATRAEVEACWQ